MRSITPDQLPLSVLEASYRLGKLVAGTRKARRLTQQALCEQAGLGRNTLAEIERGSPRVQLVYWLLVLEALDLLGNLNHALSAADVGRLADSLPRARRAP
ncbi:helix-turn-helix domain-containing protein [Thiobacillus denitrificans]|uniref:helix-turn-helix domain-containing protein n=1 Tax=Thiobacillus denitrificans TaxID=36861 RepID=UPI00075EA3EF